MARPVSSVVVFPVILGFDVDPPAGIGILVRPEGLNLLVPPQLIAVSASF
jgi:hypothetical protein